MNTDAAVAAAPDLVLHLALASAIFSAIAAIVSSFIPLLTQRSANKHTARMKRMEMMDSGRREAFERLVKSADITFTVMGTNVAQFRESIWALAGILPYVTEDVRKRVLELYDLLTIDQKLPAGWKEKYSTIIIETAKQFGEPLRR